MENSAGSFLAQLSELRRSVAAGLTWRRALAEAQLSELWHAAVASLTWRRVLAGANRDPQRAVFTRLTWRRVLAEAGLLLGIVLTCSLLTHR